MCTTCVAFAVTKVVIISETTKGFKVYFQGAFGKAIAFCAEGYSLTSTSL